MSTLRTIEKDPFEDLLGMSSGYVLDFSNDTFAAFFRESVGVSIYDPRYAVSGESKAKRLRAFWEAEGDALVGKVMSDLIELWTYRNPNPGSADKQKLERCRATISRLTGCPVGGMASEKEFLDREFGTLSFAKTNIDSVLVGILESRFAEAGRCLTAQSPLAAIFLSGSILEGLLLGLASRVPREFNQAGQSPKDSAGKVKPLPQWSLAQLIDVACELGYLKLDVKKFGHTLRDFRNYIHPYQQLSSGFAPDHHTAKICLQVLKAAIASISGQRE